MPAAESHAALVTGASRGIGRGVALALAGLGYDVALVARGVDATERTAAAARDGGAPRAIAIAGDLTDARFCEQVPAQAREALGRSPDVLVHCAGVARNGAIGELSLADWETSMSINATAAFVLASELGPEMAAAGWGRIVCIGSLYARFGVARTAAYTASKHALIGLTRAIAAEYAKKGVTANAVIPGFVDTDMIREQVDQASAARGLSHDQVIARYLEAQPIGRLIAVDEVAALVAYLCGDAAAPISGQAIHVDGGAYQA
jgi:NAD(P)-dependent dehydrogenase (short-subunit alcohol dehydrogenase family)